MSGTSLEVADIFRDHGAAWRAANKGHVSLNQMKVMSVARQAIAKQSAERGPSSVVAQRRLADMLRVATTANTSTSPTTRAVIAIAPSVSPVLPKPG